MWRSAFDRHSDLRGSANLLRVLPVSKALLFRSCNNIVLKRSGQCSEQCRITCNTNDQRLVLLGMRLSISERLTAYNVELNVATLLIEVTANESNEAFKSASAFKSGGVELHIVKSTVGSNVMIQAGNRVSARSGPLNISARRRRNTVRNWSVGKSTVGGRTGLRAKRHVCGNGIKSRLIYSAARIFVFLL